MAKRTENTIEVKRANKVGKGKDSVVFLDMVVNGVTIYGCRIIEGKKGDFIAFPSHKSSKDDKYYNHVWVDLSDEETEQIVNEAREMI